MSQPWSEMVRQFLEDGYSSSEIVAYFNHPLVTEKYVHLVADNYRRIKKKFATRKMDGKTRMTVPRPGTAIRAVYDYAQSLGGHKQFHAYVLKHSQRETAKQLGVQVHTIQNYIRDYIYGRNEFPRWLGGYPNLTMKLKMEALVKGTYKPKRKRLPIKDARNLW